MQPFFSPGSVCLVTGGTRGIGRAISLLLADAGARLLVTYRCDEASARETSRLLQAAGADAELIQADLACVHTPALLVGRLNERYDGRLDSLINNAGHTFDGAFAALAPADYESVIDVNLTGTLRLCIAAAPLLRASRGTIVNLSSLAAISGKEGQVVYSATKGALNGLTRMLARQMGPDGVRANAIAPGFIRTDMVERLPESAYAHVIAGTALRSMGSPEDVAHAALFLASRQSAYINGAVMRVDGGFHR